MSAQKMSAQKMSAQKMSATSIPLYDRLAGLYDVIYGVGLKPGRTLAMNRLAPNPGERILEVGVGTGLSALSYPGRCVVVGVDLSARMLERAGARLERRGARHVTLVRMDATRLAFPSSCFDAVYAPYFINVVDDPVGVARELMRVCAPAGRLVFLNHFAGTPADRSPTNRWVGKLATGLTGVNWHVDLDRFLTGAGLTPVSSEPANLGGVSSVVVCRKP